MITPGTYVRLTLDQGARSIGVVVDSDHVREDGVEFVAVDWFPAESAPDVLPVTILTPVCSWEAFGFLDCRFDAEREVHWDDPTEGVVHRHYCLHHALRAVIDLQRSHAAHTVTELGEPTPPRRNRWGWGHDEGGES